ncbi:MAG: bifunctional (p)ppGpp synthetase/guanosine-3',5'-bis(diphosphate) 3'-pyrophosphohydrolase [Gammaproteobacteria bacterium TMED112]|nr:MAG: bifunctional (p)ppGpp synthetase/guanosine-3',5'-bis(diphosphate) 3'-pyrophosphohydrolase [Gammaproteobacteria bacterium TMED112]
MFESISLFSKPKTSRLSVELDQLSKLYLNPLSNQKIKKAVSFADKAHEGQFRKSGEPFLIHPINVGLILASLKMDADTIIAGLLHDVVEDCEISLKTVKKEFGNNVAKLVDGMTKLLQLDDKLKDQSQAEYFQKMALATAEDVRVVIIKLADRLHNLQTIEHLPRDKQIKKAKETLELYAPLAHQIGMHKMATDLEDHSFKTIHPFRHKLIEQALKKNELNRKTLISKVKKTLRAKFKKNKLLADTKGRRKRIYSIYQKMKSKHKSFRDIYDVFAFRVTVEKVEECYKTLGIIHNVFSPISGKFKDYIAVPKMNGYQALHTVVMTFDGVPMEVQIQTSAMETFANYGIASHGLYKTKVNDDQVKAKSRQLVQRLTDMSKRSSSSLEFLESLKTDMKGKEVYVFSPNGRIFSLKQGSTSIDYAYAVHSSLGNYCLSCEIDKKLSPLSTALKSGQTVEIIKSKKKTVNAAWLNFVVTSKAITEIKKELRKVKISDARVLGKDLLEDSLHDAGMELSEYPNEQLKGVFNLLGVRSLNQLLVDIGSGRKRSNVVSQSFAEGLRGFSSSKVVAAELKIGSSEKYGAIKFPECCYPVHGDPCLAVHNELGITIHRANCENLKGFLNTPGRCSNINWEKNDDSEYLAALTMNLVNEPGALADVSKIISNNESNIQSVLTKTLDENFIELTLKILVRDIDHLNTINSKLIKNKTVTNIERKLT